MRSTLLLVGILAGCSDPSFAGKWTGEYTQHDELHVSGVDFTVNSDSTLGESWNWLVETCGDDEIAFRPQAACVVHAHLTGATHAEVTASYRCMVGEVTWTTVGGSIDVDDTGLTGSIVWDVLGPDDAAVHRYYVRTDTLVATAHADAATSLACQQGDLHPIDVADFSALAGCADNDMVFLSGAGADRTVVSNGAGFTPHCLQIAAGQTVGFTGDASGDLSDYPFFPGTPDDASAGAPGNPIMFTIAGTARTFTFGRPGDYIFHNSSSSTGMVRVR